MLKLYYSPGSCSQASHITLEEADADYEQVLVNFKTGEQTQPDYLALNPLGRVPLLATDHGTLTETPAILLYIAQLFPDTDLAPTDNPWQLAQIQSFNNFLATTVHVAHAHGRRANRWASQQSSFDDMYEKTPEVMAASMQMVEDRMQSPWVFGDRYSISDPYLFTIARWLKSDRVEVNDFPKIAAHMQRMTERPAVIRALTKEAKSD